MKVPTNIVPFQGRREEIPTPPEVYFAMAAAQMDAEGRLNPKAKDGNASTNAPPTD